MDVLRRTFDSGNVNSKYYKPRDNNTTNTQKKWPFLFWFILRFLGLFYHERIVTERKCFSCNVENITKRQTGNRLKAIDGELDYLILAYEADGDDIDEEKKWLLEEKLEEDQEDNCDVCESLWWNCDRLPERYTEEEIGKDVKKHFPKTDY